MVFNIFKNPYPSTTVKPSHKLSGAYGEPVPIKNETFVILKKNGDEMESKKKKIKMNGENTPARLRMIEKIKSRQLNKVS